MLPQASRAATPRPPSETTVYHSDPLPIPNPWNVDVFYNDRTPAASRPAVILVHGGGWDKGDRTWWSGPPVHTKNLLSLSLQPPPDVPAALLAAEPNWIAFSIDYRLVGTNTTQGWLDEPQDVDWAVSWVVVCNGCRMAWIGSSPRWASPAPPASISHGRPSTSDAGTPVSSSQARL